MNKTLRCTIVVCVLIFLCPFLQAGRAQGQDQRICLSLESDDWKQAGYVDRAIEACTRLVNSGGLRGSALSVIYRARGYWLYKKSDLDGALREYALAIKADPKNGENYDYRADVWLERKEFQRAVDDCTESIRLDRNNISAYYVRGLAYQQMGNLDRAKQDFHAALARPAKNRNDQWAQENARQRLKEL
jgi:tetratricopeptide (TPR) repeat protein